MPFKKPEYPDTCTKAYWDKKKGVIAKMAGRTGVGDALKACVAAYEAVNWDAFDINKSMPTHGGLEDLEAAWEAAASESKGKLKKLGDELKAATTLCAKVEADFKKSKTIPKDSTKLVGQIGTDLDRFMVMCAPQSIAQAVKKDYDGMKDAVEKRLEVIANGRKIAKKYVDAIWNGIAKVEVEGFRSFWSEYIRGLGTQTAVVEELRPFAKDWRAFTTNDFSSVSSPEDIQAKWKEMKPVLVKIRDALSA